MLRGRLHYGWEKFEELSSSWQRLAAESPSATPFQTYEWQSTWWRHFGHGTPILFSTWEGDDLVGIMPLLRSRGLWRALRPMGVGPSDYLHPLSRAGYEESVSEALTSILAAEPGFDLVDLHQVRETSALARFGEGRVVEQSRCLAIDLPNRFDAYVATLSKSLRYDVRHPASRRNKGQAVYVKDCYESEVNDALNALFDLHRRRWKARGLPGAFLGRSVAFQRDWAGQAASKGWLRLSLLMADDAPVGAIYGMTMGSTAYYYQAGFDPAQRHLSPGTALVAHLIERAIQDGCRTFDMMRGDEPYKRRWKPTQTVRNLRFISPGRGLRGQIGSSWNQYGSSVEARVRTRLEGKGLW